MSVNLSPLAVAQLELASGVPAVGGLLFFYAAGSTSTKQNTYTDFNGGTPNTNPIVLNALGMPNNVEIWFTAGLAYDIVYAPAGDTDPPTSPIKTFHSWRGINDVTATQSEWLAGPTPTFVSTTSFTLVGDQTSIFTVGRRVKTTNTGGTIYSTITVSAFTTLTTLTVVNDSGVLDSGLSAVSYGLLASVNPSIPRNGLADPPLISQVQNSSFTSLTAVSGTNTVVGTATPTPAAYAAGQIFQLVQATTNTGATTLNISALGAKNVFANGAACIGGELVATVAYIVFYDGTQFNIIGTAPATSITASTFTWNGTGSPGTSGSVNMTAQKIGLWVTLNIPAVSATTGTTSTILSSNTAIPAAFRPTTNQSVPANNVINNGGGIAAPGVINIMTSGIITFVRDQANTAFTNAASAGIGGNPANFAYFVG